MTAVDGSSIDRRTARGDALAALDESLTHLAAAASAYRTTTPAPPEMLHDVIEAIDALRRAGRALAYVATEGALGKEPS